MTGGARARDADRGDGADPGRALRAMASRPSPARPRSAAAWRRRRSTTARRCSRRAPRPGTRATSALGGAGDPGAEATWQNSGTLVIAGAPQLLAGSGNGVLRNTSAGTLSRDTPAGAMVAAARIENAGTVHVLAGTMGDAGPAAGARGGVRADRGPDDRRGRRRSRHERHAQRRRAARGGHGAPARELRRHRRAGLVARDADHRRRLHADRGRDAEAGDRRLRDRPVRPADRRRGRVAGRHAGDRERAAATRPRR